MADKSPSRTKLLEIEFKFFWNVNPFLLTFIHRPLDLHLVWLYKVFV